MIPAQYVYLGCEKHGMEPTGSEINTPSLLYTMLPSIIQRRVPRLRSLREAASSYGQHAHTRAVSDASQSPPPSYRTSDQTSTCESDEDEDEVFQSLPGSRPTTSGSVTPADRAETESGVNWKYAKQGSTFLSLSMQEADSLSRNPQLTRKLYIDGLEYLLNGLPLELTVQEEVGLRAAMPASLSKVSARLRHTQLTVRSAEEDCHHQQTRLHRAVASVTLYAFLVISILLPYIQLLMQKAYQYERKHRLGDRLLAHSALVAGTASKQTLTLANHLYGLNEGKFGDTVKDIGMWWIQGVSGGVYDGLDEGIQTIGLRSGGCRSRDAVRRA